MSRTVLTAMRTPEDVIDRSVLYVRIYFVGMPVNMLYNFGASIMRATGDTRRPLAILSIAGVINIVLNLVFVIVFKMGVAGVATATIISQGVSAVLVIILLARSEGVVRLRKNELKISRAELWQMVKIGLPAGLQGSLFSISNVLIQSSINSFGSVVMEGNAAAGNIENFIYTAMNSVSQASLTFTSQNYGARNFKRMNRILVCTMAVTVAIGALMGGLACVFDRQLLGIYITKTQAAIPYGEIRIGIICSTYFLCGIMDVVSGSMRGLGYSMQSMIVSLMGACVTRIIWIYTVFAAVHTLQILYASYPLSWLLTLSINLLCFIIIKKRLEKKCLVC